MADETDQRRLVHGRGEQSGHRRSIRFIPGGHYLVAKLIPSALVQNLLDVDLVNGWFIQRQFMSIVYNCHPYRCAWAGCYTEPPLSELAIKRGPNT